MSRCRRWNSTLSRSAESVGCAMRSSSTALTAASSASAIFWPFAQRWRQRHSGERRLRPARCRPGRGSSPHRPIRPNLSVRRRPRVARSFMLCDEGAEILAEQGVRDHSQRRLHHRRVHVELDPRAVHDRSVGDVLDRVDQQVRPISLRWRRANVGFRVAPVRGPRVAFIGQQVDARRRPDGFVVVGLDVFQPGPVQHVVDVVGVGYRDETSPSAAKSGDVVPARPAEEAVAGVETDRDRLARHCPRTESRSAGAAMTQR